MDSNHDNKINFNNTERSVYIKLWISQNVFNLC